MQQAALLSADHIYKDYDSKLILEDITLQIAKKERVALIGPSGCGKSTLLSVLGGLLRPERGEVFLEGGAVTAPTKRIAWMPQNDLLMPWRTVLNNVALPLRLSRVKKAQALDTAREYFEDFGLAGYEKAWPHQLSGGMRKRAAFLRTALTGADVMLLDEPFASLDAMTRTQMQDWLLQRMERLGSALVLVTHDVEEALYVCDRVVVLSPAPARIIGEVACSFEKNKAFRFSQQMGDLKKKVAALL
ncbi:MAG: ABC transporter ATP-binding protein [Christensenellales bacterium]